MWETTSLKEMKLSSAPSQKCLYTSKFNLWLDIKMRSYIELLIWHIKLERVSLWNPLQRKLQGGCYEKSSKCQFLIYDKENSAFGRERLLSVTCGRENRSGGTVCKNKISEIVCKQNQSSALYFKLKGNFQWIEKTYEP